MDIVTFVEALASCIEADADLDTYYSAGFQNADVRTFAEAGVMSGNDGLVVNLADGSEFQITVVRSK